jgi:hypothetical protein
MIFGLAWIGGGVAGGVSVALATHDPWAGVFAGLAILCITVFLAPGGNA